MIVIADKPGYLANRLIIFSAFIVYSRENGVNIRYPAFADYADYFKSTAETLSPSYPNQHVKISNKKIRNWNYKFWNLLLKISRKFNFSNSIISYKSLDSGEELDMKNFQDPIKCLIYLVGGWGFRFSSLIPKYKKEIINFFTLSEKYSISLEKYFSEIRKIDYSKIVGVHIRRGDYKKFRGGEWYYSDDLYARWMLQINNELGPDVLFIIATNEQLDLNFYEQKGLQLCLGPGSEIEDLYCLSMCDYIIGPPSTYSMWASFYGSKPLYFIDNREAEIKIKNFKIPDRV